MAYFKRYYDDDPSPCDFGPCRCNRRKLEDVGAETGKGQEENNEDEDNTDETPQLSEFEYE